MHIGITGQIPVIKADQRNVSRHGQPRLIDRCPCSKGHLIIKTENCRRLIGKELFCCAVAASVTIVSINHRHLIGIQPVLSHGDPPASVAQAGRIQLWPSLDDCQLPMAIIQKVIHGPFHGPGLVCCHIGRIDIHGTADNRHGNLL